MTNGNGWIKLHRQFKDSVYYKETKAKAVWIECLFRGQHEREKIHYLKREKIVLKAGQFVMGREEFGASIGISGSTCWYWLLQFEVDSMIDIKKTAKGSIVTIKNWKQYQQVDSNVVKKKTGKKQEKNTTKNEKNTNNLTVIAKSINELLGKFQTINPGINFGNKTQRDALEWFLKKYGHEKTLRTIEFALSVQGQQYTPTISTPLQLKNKLGDLMIYYKRENSSNHQIISI